MKKVNENFEIADLIKLMEQLERIKQKSTKVSLIKVAQRKLISSKATAPDVAYLFAKAMTKNIYIDHEYINFHELEKIVLEKGNGEMNYYYARDVYGANVPLHDEKILAEKSPVWSLQAYKYLHGANKTAHREIVMEKGSLELREHLLEYESELERHKKADGEAE